MVFLPSCSLGVKDRMIYLGDLKKADGSTQSIGFRCSGEELSILRGDQEFFGGLDSQATDDFIQLMQEILESAQ